jgi:acetolactate synthase-1/2/3 large subunit
MTQMTTGQAIVQMLLRHGVDTVFGMPGAQTYDFFDALYEQRDNIRLISVRHEQAAAYMAFGYARSTGKPGVFSVVPGPGILNTMGALCTAYGANVPIVGITSNIPTDFMGKGRRHLHEIPDQLATLRSLIKWADAIHKPEDAPEMVAEAFFQAQSGRPSPVVLEAAWDVLGQTGDVSLIDPKSLTPPDPDAAEIDAAADFIAAAKNPAVYVGGGALHAGDEVIELAELLGAPVSSFRSGRGVVSDDHPLVTMLPVLGELWEETDLIIGVGSRLEGPYMRWNLMQWQERPKEPKMVRIDIDPEEMTHWAPDAGIVGDSKVSLRALIKALKSRKPVANDQRAKIAAAKQKIAGELESVQPQMSYLNAIRAALPRDGFFVGEITQSGFLSQVAFPVYEPRTYVANGHQDTLGFGFATALGVKVANPDKAVVAITGDGGFQFTIQELATAKQFGIGLVTVLFNNGAYGNVRRDQETRYDGRTIGCELENPDFAALAKAYGVASYTCTEASNLEALVAEAIKKDAPALIDVPITYGTESSPWPFIIIKKWD